MKRIAIFCLLTTSLSLLTIGCNNDRYVPGELLSDFMKQKEAHFRMTAEGSAMAKLMYYPKQIAALRGIMENIDHEKFIQLLNGMNQDYFFELRVYPTEEQRGERLSEMELFRKEEAVKNGITALVDNRTYQVSTFHAERTFGLLPFDTYHIAFTIPSKVDVFQIKFEDIAGKEKHSWKIDENDINQTWKLNW